MDDLSIAPQDNSPQIRFDLNKDGVIEIVGRLFIKDGVLVFEGDAADSAKVFLKYFNDLRWLETGEW